MPCVTSDIYPTLLDLTGVKVKDQPPLDGISLVPPLEGKMDARPTPIGFSEFAAKREPGKRGTRGNRVRDLLEAQQAGRQLDPHTCGPDAGKITKQYPLDRFSGGVWLDWPWKLLGGKLYNLAEDPRERKDLAAEEPDRVRAMKAKLQTWQKSVVRSLNGEDYR